MKCNSSRPGFELVSPYPFPMTITITPRAPPNTPRHLQNYLNYTYILAHTHTHTHTHTYIYIMDKILMLKVTQMKSNAVTKTLIQCE